MPHRYIQRKLLENSRKLRKEQTQPEIKLWRKLRDRNLAGLKFRRQHVIETFIVDFICESKRLVIEIDGESHQDSDTHYDLSRQRAIEKLGYKVMRFDNDEVLKEMDDVLAAILNHCGIEE